MDGKNPCDVCKREWDCEDCVLHVAPSGFVCCNYECFLNRDFSCCLGLYNLCGAWEDEK